MSEFLSIRNYVHFRRYFDAVHPFFWPVLYWQLKRAWLCLQREKLTSVLLEITWWAGVRIVHRGDRIETPKPNPFALTKPRFDDPGRPKPRPIPACAGMNGNTENPDPPNPRATPARPLGVGRSLAAGFARRAAIVVCHKPS